MPALTGQLAEILTRPVGADERARAVIHLRDWFACAILGSTAEAGRALLRYGAHGAAGPAATIGVGACTAETAAFVNGGLANIFEMDDTHRLSVLHPGDSVIPAALAVAQREGAGGAALLDAIVRGYEAVIRIGEAAGTEHYRHWYSTATCGVFGAAAAAGSLLGLDTQAMQQALGSAGMQATGIWQCRMEPGHGKQLATARAAQSGVVAADLAGLGFIAPAQILEGEHGFFIATGARPNLAAVGAPTADGAWKLWEMSFKPWPACRATHPAIEAALVARSKLDPQRVRRVEVEIFNQAIIMCDQPKPATPHEGRFSLQHCVATTLLHGAPRLAHFEPEWLGRTDVAALRAQVDVRQDADLTKAFPARLGISMRVELDNGDSARFQLWTAKGDPENPMTDDELREKAVELLGASGLSSQQVGNLLAAIADVPEARSLDRLGQTLIETTTSGIAPLRSRAAG